MKRLLTNAGFILACCAPATVTPPPPAAPASAGSADARVLAIGDEVVADLFAESPQRVAFWRVPGLATTPFRMDPSRLPRPATGTGGSC